MSKIIILNGPSSSGKTSIARAIQANANEPYMHLGIDTITNMVPYQYGGFGKKADNGFYSFNKSLKEGNQIIDIKTTAKGEKMFGLLPDFAALIANQGINLVIDEVIFKHETRFEEYKSKLKKHQIFTVGIFCNLEDLIKREESRGDRDIGLSRAQIDIVHEGKKYDMKIYSDDMTSLQASKKILEALI